MDAIIRHILALCMPFIFVTIMGLSWSKIDVSGGLWYFFIVGFCELLIRHFKEVATFSWS